MNVLATDRVLAQHPWHALFFAVFALYLYGTVFVLIGKVIFPGLPALLELNDSTGLNLVLIIQALTFFSIFLHMTVWAERVGAGPFAAPIETRAGWAIGAIVGGPVVYSLALAFGYYVIAGGAENWAYADRELAEFVDESALTISMFIAVVVIGPVFEEVAYRGIAMGALLGRGLPPLVAIVVPAFFFALSHTQYTFAALVSVFIFGIFLGILRLKSQSIAPAILAHMSVNFYLTVGVG